MREDQFERFWKSYPRRVGKGAARKAFAKAIKLTTLETILTAIEAYKRCKPGYADFCHPSTWLNQERWNDEWSALDPVKQRTPSDVFDDYLRQNDDTTHGTGGAAGHAPRIAPYH